MVIVLLVAAVLRMAELPQLPVGLHYDEAANLILTRQIANGTYRPVFIRAYTGKEVLFFYLAAPWVKIVGGRAWGLRLGAAMVGLLTVAVTYTAVCALLKSHQHTRSIALWASAWVAVSFPHVLLSRYGFRAISQPLLQALTVATLWRGLDTGAAPSKRQTLWRVAGGGCLGLTAYTYLAARLFPIPMALGLGVLIVKQMRTKTTDTLVFHERLGQVFKTYGLVFSAALVIFAPLGFYFLRHPDAFMTRIEQVRSPTWPEAWHGVQLCLRALVWPGSGDPYIRFNVPGRALLSPIVAILTLIGLGVVLYYLGQDTARRESWVFLLALLMTMILPSALATSEITPSNLRLVGLYPFLGILPALGALVVIQAACRQLALLARHSTRWWLTGGLGVLLVLEGGATGWSYARWAGSADLFYASDGEMTLVAEAIDALDLTTTTAYIASLHYRHPTVAALARAYAHTNVKWLTGGATLVLPAEGAGVYLVPRSLKPPTPWPPYVTDVWTSTARFDPEDAPALWSHRVSARDIPALRPTQPEADFAHVVFVHDACAARACHIGKLCPVLITWEIRAPYTTLQPVARITHPQIGEWARETVFHYPVEQWTPGEVVLDQLTLALPPSMPPVSGYEIGVGFFNPDSGVPLPCLNSAEQFAGLEVRFPWDNEILPQAVPSAKARCGGSRWDVPKMWETVSLWGADVTLGNVLPGEKIPLTLCWQMGETPLSDVSVTLELLGDDGTIIILYNDAPVQGLYPFSEWPPGAVVEDRYALRLPRDLSAGTYTLRLRIEDAPLYDFGSIMVQALEREFAETFELPPSVQRAEADFGSRARLLGYTLGTAQPGQVFNIELYWQTLAEMEENYTIFVHIVDAVTGQIRAQIDEGPQQEPGRPYPTSLWMLNEIVRDVHAVTLPSDLPAGDYNVRLGFYVPETGQRLAVFGEDSFDVAEIHVALDR